MKKKIFFAILPLLLAACLLIFREDENGIAGVLYYWGLYALPFTYLIYIGCLTLVNSKSIWANFALAISVVLITINILFIFSGSRLKSEYRSKNKYELSENQFNTWLHEMNLPRSNTAYEQLIDRLFYYKGGSSGTPDRFFCNPQNFDKDLFQETIKSIKIFPIKGGYVFSNKVTALNAKKISHFVAVFTTNDQLIDIDVSTCRDEFWFDPVRLEDWDNDGRLDLIVKGQSALDTSHISFFTKIYDITENDVTEKFSMEDSTISKNMVDVLYMSNHTKSIANFEKDGSIKMVTTAWKVIDESLKKELIKKDSVTAEMLKAEAMYIKTNQLAPTKRVSYCKRSAYNHEVFNCIERRD
jgi:hypothetical protein